jgi:hypothetical protein
MTFDPTEIPAAWCRMWSEDASLAHRLLTEDARQWSGVTEGLDPVIGPAATEAFVRRYQQDVGNVFRPRTLVVQDDRLAYTWDVTRRDGTVTTGADVCFLRDGLVAENWTVPSRSGRSSLPDGPSSSGLSLTGPSLTGPAVTREELLALTADAHPWHRDRVADVHRRTVSGVWQDDAGRGGIAVLVVEDGRVDREWSIGGTRKLLY